MLKNYIGINFSRTLSLPRIEEAGRMLPLPEEDVDTVQESNNHQEADVLENFSPRVYQTPGLQG